MDTGFQVRFTQVAGCWEECRDDCRNASQQADRSLLIFPFQLPKRGSLVPKVAEPLPESADLLLAEVHFAPVVGQEKSADHKQGSHENIADLRVVGCTDR